jgi:hypothetical protein
MTLKNKLTENYLRRLFPRAPESFFKRNKDNIDDPRSSSKPKSMDWSKVRQTPASQEVGKTHRLVDCSIEFFAVHGQKLDRDNKDNIRKIIWDAVANLGFEDNDKDFDGKVEQRMDPNYFNIYPHQ